MSKYLYTFMLINNLNFLYNEQKITFISSGIRVVYRK